MSCADADAEQWDEPDDHPASPPPAGRSGDLGVVLEQAAAQALDRRLARLADTALDDALDADLTRRLRTAADDAAAAVLEKYGEPDPGLFHPSLDRFVARFLAPTYRRHVDGRSRTWCPAWWRHEEAIARLEALWRAWEHLRLDPATGASVWFRDHADHHMPILLDPDTGPFKHCSAEKGHSSRMERLPLEQPPPGLFPSAARD